MIKIISDGFNDRMLPRSVRDMDVQIRTLSLTEARHGVLYAAETDLTWSFVGNPELLRTVRRKLGLPDMPPKDAEARPLVRPDRKTEILVAQAVDDRVRWLLYTVHPVRVRCTSCGRCLDDDARYAETVGGLAVCPTCEDRGFFVKAAAEGWAECEFDGWVIRPKGE